MDQRNLIHPMTAGDLVISACVLAVHDKLDTGEAVISIWECTELLQIPEKVYEDAERETLLAAWPRPGTRAKVTFYNRQTDELHEITLKAETPLLFTRISA